MAAARRPRPAPDREPPDLADELWTARHLARYLHCGRSTVFVTVGTPGFPAARAVGPARRRLWLGAEVRAWAGSLPPAHGPRQRSPGRGSQRCGSEADGPTGCRSVQPAPRGDR